MKIRTNVRAGRLPIDDGNTRCGGTRCGGTTRCGGSTRCSGGTGGTTYYV